MTKHLTKSLVLAALALSPILSWADAAEDVQVTSPWARAVPPVMKNSAAFMTLNNTGPGRHTLVSASSSVAGVVELHTHTHEGGMMRMRQVENIPVPAKSTTALQPGGLHIMLMQLKEPLTEGMNINITLNFADGSSKEITAPVQKMPQMAPGAMNMKQNMPPMPMEHQGHQH